MSTDFVFSEDDRSTLRSLVWNHARSADCPNGCSWSNGCVLSKALLAAFPHLTFRHVQEMLRQEAMRMDIEDALLGIGVDVRKIEAYVH